MDEKGKNRYVSSRLCTGLSREVASERLGVSTSALAKYESGQIRVPDGTVQAMAKTYRDPWITFQHLRAQGYADIPELDEPESDGDMFLQLSVAKDFLEAGRAEVKQSIVQDGQKDKAKESLLQALTGVLSSVLYIKKLEGEANE